MREQLTELPPPATSLRAELPASIGAAIDKCVAKQPDDRFASAEQLVEAIDAAQVAAPEIPLAIRLMAQELGTVSLILFFLVMMSPLIVSSMSAGGRLDAVIPLILMGAIATTRLSQTFGASRRLIEDGFTPEEMLNGMRAVLAERTSVREGYRANPGMQRRRRRSLRMAGVFTATAVILIVVTSMQAVNRGNHRFAVTVTGLVTGIIALVLLGISLMTVLRSPFRAPPSDKVFQRVWLGPLGRAFVRLSARGVKRSGGATIVSRPTMTPAPPVALPKSVSVDRLAELEARLAALEKKQD